MKPEKDLQEAARAYEKSILAALPEPEDCPAGFSPAFERRMKKLINRVDHPVRYWLARLLPVLLAVAAAAAALALGGQDQSAPPPAPADTAVPETVTVYRPTWLPESWELNRETLYGGEGMAVYAAPSGGEATFLYALEDREVPADGTPVMVGDAPGVLCLGQTKGALNDLYWSEGEVSFWLSAPFTEEELLRVAESVEAVAIAKDR